MNEFINVPELLGIEPKHVWFMIGALALIVATERYDERQMRKKRDDRFRKMD